MMPVMLILVALGLGLVVYAVFEVFKPGKPEALQKQKIHARPIPAEDPGKEQKIQRLQSQVAKLESQLEQAQAVAVGEKSGSETIQEKEAEFSAELKRREEWVAKAEAELAKTKADNSDLNNKFIAKEKELQDEFTKNVNLNREMREIKTALEAKEMACRLKEDQLQAQKHQVESQLKTINEHAATIAEFSRKEKISEWVPKLEFNQLNAEYAKLEKDLEDSQERLKSFAAEIAHLRQEKDRKIIPAQEEKPQEEGKGEELSITPETSRQDLLVREQSKNEIAPQEVNPEVIKPEETKTPNVQVEKGTEVNGEQKKAEG